MANKSSTHASEKDSAAVRKAQHRARALSHQTEQANAADALARALNEPASTLVPADILALQRTAGNRAVEHMLVQRVQHQQPSRLTVQTKLAVGSADDPYEREADRVAEMVMHSSEHSVPHVQRAASEEEDDEKKVQAKPLASSITPLIQRSELPDKHHEDSLLQRLGNGGAAAVEPGLERSIERARASGNSLPDKLRTRMESAFGADFSRVRIHADSESDLLNRSLQSRAFTTGYDLFFKRGEYNPGSRDGQGVIAHELTHVVQQNGNSRIAQSGEIARGSGRIHDLVGKNENLQLIQRLSGSQKKDLKTYVDPQKAEKSDDDERKLLVAKYTTQVRPNIDNHQHALLLKRLNYQKIESFLSVWEAGTYKTPQNVRDMATDVLSTKDLKVKVEDPAKGEGAKVKMKVHDTILNTARNNPKEFWRVGSGGGDKRTAPDTRVLHHHMYDIYTWSVLHTPFTDDGSVKVLGEVRFHMEQKMGDERRGRINEILARENDDFKSVETDKDELKETKDE